MAIIGRIPDAIKRILGDDAVRYFEKLREQAEASIGTVAWGSLNFASSDLDDLATKDHADLDNITGATKTSSDTQQDKHVSNNDLRQIYELLDAAEDHESGTNAVHGVSGQPIGTGNAATTAQRGAVFQAGHVNDPTGSDLATLTSELQDLMDSLRNAGILNDTGSPPATPDPAPYWWDSFDSGAIASPSSVSGTVDNPAGHSNTCLFIAVSVFALPADYPGGEADVTAVTFGASGLTHVATIEHPDNYHRIELWRLIAPTTGSGISWSASLSGDSSSVGVEFIFFENVDQTTPVDVSQNATDTWTGAEGTHTLDITTANADSAILFVHNFAYGRFGYTAAASSLTELLDFGVGDSSGGHHDWAGWTAAASATLYTVGCVMDGGGSEQGCGIAVEVVKV